MAGGSTSSHPLHNIQKPLFCKGLDFHDRGCSNLDALSNPLLRRMVKAWPTPHTLHANPKIFLRLLSSGLSANQMLLVFVVAFAGIFARASEAMSRTMTTGRRPVAILNVIPFKP